MNFTTYYKRVAIYKYISDRNAPMTSLNFSKFIFKLNHVYKTPMKGVFLL